MEQRIVLHETLHCFLGNHSGTQIPSPYGADDGVMNATIVVTGTAEQNKLTPRQLKYIQTDEKYKPWP